MNARQSKIKVFENIYNTNKEKIDKILELISKAVEQSKSHIVYDGFLMPDIQYYLTNNLYYNIYEQHINIEFPEAKTRRYEISDNSKTYTLIEWL